MDIVFHALNSKKNVILSMSDQIDFKPMFFTYSNRDRVIMKGDNMPIFAQIILNYDNLMTTSPPNIPLPSSKLTDKIYPGNDEMLELTFL